MNRSREYERLVFDRYCYCGHYNCLSWCALELLPLADGRTAVIATELKENPGTSITNACAELAFYVCMDFGIDPKRLVWIEHYSYAAEGGTGNPRAFDLATFDFVTSGSNWTFANPRWRRMTDPDWIDLGLPPRPPVDYGDCR